MHIDLTDNEVKELVVVLESFLPEFSAEIDSVNQYDWHDDLRNDALTLDRILNKLRQLKTTVRPGT